MELNREQIIKALEYCTAGGSCNKCPYDDNPRLSVEACLSSKMRDALALIKELTEENERLERICHSYALQYGTATDKEVFLKKERADTVQSMRSRVKERCIAGGIYPAFVENVIDRIAKEILDETQPIGGD